MATERNCQRTRSGRSASDRISHAADAGASSGRAKPKRGASRVQRLGQAIALLAAAAPLQAMAQDAQGSNLAQQLANPVANLISVPFQSNLDVGGGRGDALRYTLNFQPVVPFSLSEDWNLITRTIVPLSHAERVFADHRTGLGDVLQSFFFSPSRPSASGITWGAGPVILYPTATERGLGSRQWGGGPTGVVLQQNGRWLYGVLGNHVWGFGGEGPERPSVNATFLQPFLAHTFPTQTTLSLNLESSYDWARRQWTVPVNLGANQLVNISGQAVQFGAGLRYFAEALSGGPDWGIRLSATLVFPR
jgi:hypothetical protein